MTATAAPDRAAARHESTLTGTGRLVRFMLRRDRTRLLVWIVALLALYGYFVTALGTIYATEAERQTRPP